MRHLKINSDFGRGHPFVFSYTITAFLVQSNTTFVVIFIIYYSTGYQFRSIRPSHQANFKLKNLKCYSFEMLKYALHKLQVIYSFGIPFTIYIIYNLTDKV